MLTGKFIGFGAGFIIYIPIEHHFRPIILGPVYLYQRGGGRHHDHRLGPIAFCSIGHALGMIARRSGNKPLLPLFLGQGA